MKKEISEIKIGEIGTIDINIPLIKIGSGKPKVLLLCGVHGNEVSGLFVIQKLLENLKLETGELSIITAANPLAQALNQRETPTDSKDLNRIFPGNPEKEGLTERLATAIFDKAKNCDLVIDLHTFPDPCPIVSIFMNQGSEEIKQKSIQAIKMFNPDIVWKLKPASKLEAHFSGALGPKLAEEGVANFAVEMPKHFRISNQQLDQVVRGLINTMSLLGMTEPKNKKAQKSISILERRKFISDQAGLFTPQKRLMEGVRKEEKVGDLISVKTFEKTEIRSPFSGPLIILKDKSLVSTGNTLFSVGIKTGEI